MPTPDATAVLFDVDGTLVDAVDNQRRIWGRWADQYGLDRDEVYALALRTRPADTVARFLPVPDRLGALERFHLLEDDDVLHGRYTAFDGAEQLLRRLDVGRWALVTANLRRRVEGRFLRLRLPTPRVIVDAQSTRHGKPDPEPYLLAAAELHISPAQCLVVEDSVTGVAAGLAAGMTVWTVNGPTPPSGSHRHFVTLADAAAEILRFGG
jgi:sugar-phosphatase